MTNNLKCLSCPNSSLALLTPKDFPENQTALREVAGEVYHCNNCNRLYSLNNGVLRLLDFEQ
jgi:uncharacterized protein YbaR (Trm112 family)